VSVFDNKNYGRENLTVFRRVTYMSNVCQ